MITTTSTSAGSRAFASLSFAWIATATATNPSTRDGVTVVTVELNEWVKDQKAFWSRLRLGLAEFKASALPAATLPPFVNSDFGESVALLIGVTSPQRSYEELRRYTERIEDSLRVVKGVGRIKRALWVARGGRLPLPR